MKYLTYIVLIIFSINFEGFGQTNPLRPFRMGIVKPDTAVIHQSLEYLTDSVEYNHEQQYYNSIKQMEQILEFTDYPEDMKEDFEQTKKDYKIKINYLKKYKDKILDFQYYEFISSYSIEAYNFFFNEHEPYSEIYEIANPGKLSAKQLADSLKLDYILFYENLHTESEGDKWRMKMTSKLFSAQENKIILNRQIETGSENYGGMWTCLNELTCLLINSIRESVEPIFVEIRKRQLK